MGFTWTEDIGFGASIDVADIAEIRANVDTVDNEKCASDKVSHNTDYKDGDDIPHYVGYLNNEHGTYKSGDDSGYDSTYYPGAQTDEHGTYFSGYQSGYDSTNNTPVQSVYDVGG